MLNFKFVQFLTTNVIVVLLALNCGITHASTAFIEENMNLIVRNNTLYAGAKKYPCAIGKGGLKSDKVEGDGATPVGKFPLRRLWYRKDCLDQQPQTKLPIREIHQDDGWCDDAKDPEHYNRPVTLPYAGSHEKMWRDDHLYDLVIEVGYNDDPPVLGKGSAIFIHISRPNSAPTAGCVALTKEHLLEILLHLSTASQLVVEEK